MALWRPTRPSRTNTQKRCPFHYRGLECKSRKSRNTKSNRQIWPWRTEWSRAKAIRVLPREHTSHSKHSFPTTQEKTLHMDITRWSTPKSDWLYSLQPKVEKFYIVSKNKTSSWLAQVMNSLFPITAELFKILKDNAVKVLHWCIEQSYGLCGRGRGWEDLGEWHWNM